MPTIDIQFTPEGVSATAYADDSNAVIDEAWFTWAEVEERRTINASDITFEL